MGNILIIEDNEDIAAGLRDNLELEGHSVRTAGTGEAGVSVAREWDPDVIVLDLGLPDMQGHQVMRVLRRHNVSAGILILSARDAEAEKVVGLRLGAEDYVTKPFGMLELLTRIDLILRRGRQRVTPSLSPSSDAPAPAGESVSNRSAIRIGDVEIDRAARLVWRRGERVALSPKEFELLDALVHRRGAVVRRSDLLREVWGYAGFVSSRTVDTHVAQLRRKLEDDAANPRVVLTVQKVGYRVAI